jgi:hypothetical protein
LVLHHPFVVPSAPSGSVVGHPSVVLSAPSGGDSRSVASKGRAVVSDMKEKGRTVRFEQHSEKTRAEQRMSENCCFPHAVPRPQGLGMLDQLRKQMERPAGGSNDPAPASSLGSSQGAVQKPEL